MKELPLSAAVKSACFSYLPLVFQAVTLLATPILARAAAPANAERPGAPVEATFNSNFLIGGAQSVDLSRFRDGNPVLAGKYLLDIYVNGEWKGEKHL